MNTWFFDSIYCTPNVMHKLQCWKYAIYNDDHDDTDDCSVTSTHWKQCNADIRQCLLSMNAQTAQITEFLIRNDYVSSFFIRETKH